MWRRDGAPGRRLRLYVGIAAMAALALLAAACSGSGPSTTHVSPVASAKTTAPPPAAQVRITPANGAADADPSAGITVTATRGTLKNVAVRTSGHAVSGRLSQGGKVWHSQWALDVSQTYTVTATASGSDAGSVPPARARSAR